MLPPVTLDAPSGSLRLLAPPPAKGLETVLRAPGLGPGGPAAPGFLFTSSAFEITGPGNGLFFLNNSVKYELIQVVPN